jgi:hypothetical protein
MNQSSTLAACLVINVASLLFQFILFIHSGYENLGMSVYTALAILYNFQAWSLSSLLSKTNRIH